MTKGGNLAHTVGPGSVPYVGFNFVDVLKIN